jgi:RHS repeat-associated protein
VWRNDSAQTVVYTPFRELMRIINSTGTYDFSYIYDGSTLVARIEPDGSKHYYHPDHLGSTTLITDEDGNVVEETFYEPFGAVTSGGTSDVKLYTGQFADDINNQYYYGARYYNPHIGKFMQPDPVIQAVYDPQFLNHYAYVRNNPYLLIDPNGKDARVYLDKGAASGLGHTAVGIDDIDIQGYQVIYDNRGIGEERIGSKTVRRILSFLSIVEPKVELRYGPIRDKAGNVILPEYGEQGYDDYFIIEQSREADEAMITQGFLLLRNPGKYNALTSSSLHFSLNILNAGRLDYNTINPVPNHVYYDLKGKVHQVKRFFVNPRTGELVGLKPGESYDPDKDEIVKDDNK